MNVNIVRVTCHCRCYAKSMHSPPRQGSDTPPPLGTDDGQISVDCLGGCSSFESIGVQDPQLII